MKVRSLNPIIEMLKDIKNQLGVERAAAIRENAEGHELDDRLYKVTKILNGVIDRLKLIEKI